MAWYQNGWLKASSKTGNNPTMILGSSGPNNIFRKRFVERQRNTRVRQAKISENRLTLNAMEPRGRNVKVLTNKL